MLRLQSRFLSAFGTDAAINTKHATARLAAKAQETLPCDSFQRKGLWQGALRLSLRSEIALIRARLPSGEPPLLFEVRPD